MIPQLLHRVWPGDDVIPDEYERYWATWALHHPHWEMVTWRPDDYLPLRNQSSYEAATSNAQRADIARYEILHRHGGIYVDTDFECLRPFDDLLEGIDGFAGREDETVLCISLMGARPRHPFIDQLVAMVPYSIATKPGMPANHQTGPWLATQVLNEGSALFTPPLFKVFDPSYFYPYRYDELYRKDEEFPNAYAVHRWAGSWLPNGCVQRAPAAVRVLLELDWTEPPAHNAVMAAFGSLFVQGDPVEVVIPLRGSTVEAALPTISATMVMSGAAPELAKNIVVYGDDKVKGLACDSIVSLRAPREQQETEAVAVLTQHRQRLDAYHAHQRSLRTAV